MQTFGTQKQMAIGTHCMLCLEESLSFPVSDATKETLVKYWCSQDFLCWMWPIFAVLSVWLVIGALIPSFRREVNNLREWFVTVGFFINLRNYSVKLVHSSNSSFMLILPRWDLIRMQAHHAILLILRSLVVSRCHSWTCDFSSFGTCFCPFAEWYHMSEDLWR